MKLKNLDAGKSSDHLRSLYDFLTEDFRMLPYYMIFWRHVNLAILKNPYLATL